MARKDKAYYQEVQMVDKTPSYYCKQIQKMLLNHEYKIKPEDYTIKIINDKGKTRVLHKLSYYPHRIIQWAIMLQIEQIFMKTFTSFTCASLPKRGIHKALFMLHNYLRDVEGTQYCLKMDIQHFYPSVNHEILKSLLRKKFKDPELLSLLDMVIDSNDEGLPIGSYLSQYLANFYLAYFDHWLKEEKDVKYVIRYMDDIVILSDNKEFLHQLRKDIQKYLKDNLKLELKSNYQVFPVESRGVDFVGYISFHDYTLLRKKTKQNFKKSLIKIQKNFNARELKVLTSHETAIIVNYKGWLKWGDCYKLQHKYITSELDLMAFIHVKTVSERKVLLGDTY